MVPLSGGIEGVLVASSVCSCLLHTSGSVAEWERAHGASSDRSGCECDSSTH